tara:strand:+ start:653 stop:805 length:153 start_codon:yes stop_codon:yes gene_type:complete
MEKFETTKHFTPNSENERTIVPFEFWIAVALIFGAPGWYFIFRFVKNVWF